MENKVGERKRDEKPVRTAGLSSPSRRSRGEPLPPGCRSGSAQGRPVHRGRAEPLPQRRWSVRRSGRHILPSRATPAQLSHRRAEWTSPITGDTGTEERQPATRGCHNRSGPRSPAEWFGPCGGSRDPRALGGDPGWPRAEPSKEPGQGPGPAPGLGIGIGTGTGTGTSTGTDTGLESAALTSFAISCHRAPSRDFPWPQGGAVFSAGSARFLHRRLSTHRLCKFLKVLRI